MAVGIKTVETTQHRFPTGILLMLFHALVMSNLDYCLLFFFNIISSLLLSLEKQKNWSLKSVFFRSKKKSSYELRKQGYNQYTSLDYVQIFDLFLSVLFSQKKSFQNQLKLPTATNRWTSRSNQVIYMGIFYLFQRPSFRCFIVLHPLLHSIGTHYRYKCEIQV